MGPLESVREDLEGLFQASSHSVHFVSSEFCPFANSATHAYQRCTWGHTSGQKAGERKSALTLALVRCPLNPLGLIHGGVGHDIHAIESLDNKRRGGTRRQLPVMATKSLPLILPLLASTSPRTLSSLALLGH